MQTKLYKDSFTRFFDAADLDNLVKQSVEMVKNANRIFFLGNGGSNSICSHMMQDYAKIGRCKTFAFSDPSLITCFANDFGYENAMKEYLNIHFEKGDLLIAISSSGESKNILNAADFAHSKGGKVLALSGFKVGNSLSKKGDISFYIPAENFGLVECFHQVILHIILDSLNEN